MSHPPREIFKAYDIRGIVGKTITQAWVEIIGKAIGSTARDQEVSSIVIGRDGRLSGPDLAAALARGIQSTGVDVIDVGAVATPMLYFAAHQLGTLSGVMVTGSHNPADYNGLKMMLAGETLAGAAIQTLYQRIEQGDFHEGDGQYRQHDIVEAYLQRITDDIQLTRSLNIVIDCGNGIPGAFAPTLYRRLGCRVRELFCEVDGTFPNHHPDPSQAENLHDVIDALQRTDAELGLAFDGDGDRLGVVTKDGTIIYPDRQLMLFAADMLQRQPGATVVFDVKCTRNLAPWIKQHQGKPVMGRTGHSFIKAQMKQTGAQLGGEMSGHIFFKERWYGFDDGLYAGARLLEILSQVEDPCALLHALPNSISTPELQIRLNQEGEQHALIEQLQQTARFPDAQVIEVDGLRVEYADGFGLMRASNTTPVVVLRFEADSQEGLRRIQDTFRTVLHAARPELTLPF